MQHDYVQLLLVGLAFSLVLITGLGAIGGVFDSGDRGGEGLAELWVSETGREIESNHHAPVAARIGGEPMVFAPISGIGHDHAGDSSPHSHSGNGCALVGLYGSNGTVRWSDQVPAGNCTVHSVADTTFGNLTGGSQPEVVAATTEDAVLAFDPMTGAVQFRYQLSSYGYSAPIVVDVTGDARSELIVVDVRGSVFVVAADGTTVWERVHDTYTWGQPRLGDFDGEGDRELFLALGNGSAMVFDAESGELVWQRANLTQSAITWTASGDATGDDGVDAVVATVGGRVSVVEGSTGKTVWSRDIGAFAAVRALGDGDGDGEAELYAVARDGNVTAFTAATGAIEWTRSVTEDSVQMMPPPSLGSVDSDGGLELVVATNNGRVVVLDAGSGEVRASYERSMAIRVHPVLADLDEDGVQEIYVMYGNGRVVALEVESPSRDLEKRPPVVGGSVGWGNRY